MPIKIYTKHAGKVTVIVKRGGDYYHNDRKISKSEYRKFFAKRT